MSDREIDMPARGRIWLMGMTPVDARYAVIVKGIHAFIETMPEWQSALEIDLVQSGRD
jgi:hypothetical protein